MAIGIRGHGDASVDRVADVLRDYQQLHADARIEVYRQNSASIRARIIDPDFAKIPRAERHEIVWAFLEKLPEWEQSQVSVLLLLAPEEADNSVANHDFDHPRPSRL